MAVSRFTHLISAHKGLTLWAAALVIGAVTLVGNRHQSAFAPAEESFSHSLGCGDKPIMQMTRDQLKMCEIQEAFEAAARKEAWRHKASGAPPPINREEHTPGGTVILRQ
jgi:hypothetical protein